MEIIKDLVKNPFEKIKELSINQLEEIIILANDAFFNSSEPLMDDTIYDILIDWLKLKAPKSKIFKTIGAKIKSKNKVKLDYWLGSMDKIKSSYTKEFEKWVLKYEHPYYISDKLDGISALIVYRNNSIINMYTRGTSNEGLDITPLIKYMDLPSWDKIKNNIKASKKDVLLAVRGELILDKKTFEKNWSLTMKNARNAVSGLVNSKNINPKLAIDTRFIMYEIIDPVKKFDDQMKIGKELGFQMVTFKIFNKITFHILSEYLKLRRDKSEFNVDGIIITNNFEHIKNSKGNPEYAFAYKDILEDQIAITKVINVEWNKSKDGYIKPTLILEPVKIGGVEINRVTGHNAKFIVDNNIGINTQIELIRSGDVIPHVQKIIKSTKVVLPSDPWHWNETQVDIIADDLNTNDILVKNIYYFFSSLDTKGVGEKVIEKLVAAGYNSIKKILLLTEKQIVTIDRFKEVSAKNIVNSIKNATTSIPLVKLMAASNKLGHGIGEERCKSILEKYPNLLEIYKSWTKIEFIENLKEINGFEEKTSTLFVDNFEDFIKFYNSIKHYISLEKKEVKEIIKSKYTDKIIVLSGFRDASLESKLESMGAKITNSISKNTDFLVVKDESIIKNQTGKVKKALELGIKIISRDKLF